MSKRSMTLADRILYQENMQGLAPKHLTEHVRNKIRAAHRFIFNETASKRLGEFISSSQQLILDNHTSARAPFETCFLEIDFESFFIGLLGASSPITADKSVGYLYDHGKVYVVAGGTIERPDFAPHVLPVIYSINTPFTSATKSRFLEISGIYDSDITPLFFGATLNGRTAEEIAALPMPHSCEMIIDEKFSRRFIRKKNALLNFMNSFVGDLKNVLSAFLLLNRPSITTISEKVASEKHFSKGKVRQYLSHDVISINLDEKSLTAAFRSNSEEHAERRQHDVRGHYCINEHARNASCLHSWKTDEARADRNSWICESCGGKRWWRSEHKRGSSAVGYKINEYAVTSGEK